MSAQSLPPTSELFPVRQLIQRHPHLLTTNRMTWITRFRDKNGLTAGGIVFESPVGELLIHEPKFLEWFLGLSSRAKPRRVRTARAEAVAP